MQWRIERRGLPPLFLDQTEAQKAKTNFGGRPLPPPFSKGLDDRGPRISQGLDPALSCVFQSHKMGLLSLLNTFTGRND